MIPFILSPIVFGLLTWLVMKIGLIPYPNGINIPWTMPPFYLGCLFLDGAVPFGKSLRFFYPLHGTIHFLNMIDKQAYQTEMNLATPEEIAAQE